MTKKTQVEIRTYFTVDLGVNDEHLSSTAVAPTRHSDDAMRRVVNRTVIVTRFGTILMALLAYVDVHTVKAAVMSVVSTAIASTTIAHHGHATFVGCTGNKEGSVTETV